MQRYYDGGSHIVVAFSVRCGLLLLASYQRRIAFAGFNDYIDVMLVVAASDGTFVEV